MAWVEIGLTQHFVVYDKFISYLHRAGALEKIGGYGVFKPAGYFTVKKESGVEAVQEKGMKKHGIGKKYQQIMTGVQKTCVEPTFPAQVC